METFEVMSPVGADSVEGGSTAQRAASLNGKTICETWNGDFKGDDMFPLYRELFRERYPGVKIIPYTEFPRSPLRGAPSTQDQVAREIAALAKEKGCDALISGNGG